MIVMSRKVPKEARISARVHISEKEKLKKNGYNARHAIEYFNHASSKKLDALKIEQFFLNKEIEDLKYDLIAKEMKLESIQKQIDECHIDKLSSLRVESYQKIIDIYNRWNTNESFEDFINGGYVREKFIESEVPVDCDIDTFCDDLLNYYDDVILVSKSF